MRSKSEKKPINVLAEFITDWIRENSNESMPFDSFETIRDKRIGQKDVERWIFNCNYTYYRFGDFLYEHDLLPADSSEVESFLELLDTRFKTISDNNPLNLRSRQNSSIAAEFLKDWPPFAESSRNTADHFARAMQAYRAWAPDLYRQHRSEFERFEHAVLEEQSLYVELASNSSAGITTSLERCRTLLPIWVLKEINPLYSLLLWEDVDAVANLCQRMRDAFENAGFPSYDGSCKHDSYTGLVMRSQREYLDGFNGPERDLKQRNAGELLEMLESDFFSLDHRSPSDTIPDWLYGKSQLIWNVVVCSIFGPREALTGSRPIRTSTASLLHSVRAESKPEELSGEVLLRRHFRNGRMETIDRIMLDDVQSDGLWKVIGSNYDENAALPQSAYRNQYRNLGVLFIGSQRFNAMGAMTEGEGDSRFHVEISIQLKDNGAHRLILTDLGSKNGTYVIRQDESGTACLVLKSRSRRSIEEWRARIGIPGCSITIVDKLALRRGDIIQLCGSCFEVI